MTMEAGVGPLTSPRGALSEQLAAALRSHQQGEFALAESLYAQVLEEQPRHRDALHFAGVLQVQTGRLEQGIELIRRSLQIESKQPGALMNLGNALRELARPLEALGCFEQALRLNPRFAQALYNRGNVLADLGRLDEALASLERALLIQPEFAEAYYQQGNVLMRLHRPHAALASYERSLELMPNHFGATHNRGNALLEVRRPGEALASYERALALYPASAETLTNRGNVLRALHRTAEALESYERALALQPDAPETWNSHGGALRELGRPGDALSSFQRALELRPRFAEALNNRGNALRDLNRHLEAIDCYQRAVQIKPALADPLINWGIALRELQRPQEALGRIEAALKLEPTAVEALNNRGNTLIDLARTEEALGSYATALSLDPMNPDTWRNQGVALQKLGRHVETADCFRRLLRLAPEYEYALGSALEAELMCCDWRQYDASVNGVVTAIEAGRSGAMPFAFLAVSASAPAQLACAQLRASKFVAACASTPPPRPVAVGARTRVRIAYLSADLREHVVAYLMVGVIEQHDRERFEIIGISLSAPDHSAIEQRLKVGFDQFVDVSGRSDADVLALIADLQIDILVDLTGYTDGNRTGLLAARAVPVQVNYLGFPGTMGAGLIDYIIADSFVVPDDQRRHYAESVVRLPDCFQANDDRRPIGQLPTRSAAGLPETGVALCCFNSSYKLNPPMFDRWCRILAATTGSFLWLLGHEPIVRQNLMGEATRRGIAAERLVFAERLPYPQHLGRLALADLFLDTLPFNAGATASDALWAGVPVLTCPGEAFAARMAGSLLRTVGLPELIAPSLDEYERRAIELAGDPRRLGDLKQRLQANRRSSALFDTPRFCRHLEAAYEHMWRRAERGEPPADFTLEPMADDRIIVPPSGSNPAPWLQTQ
jgi:predicted O-linked N-acetylglucosamine transferase (SPINDLY family)